MEIEKYNTEMIDIFKELFYWLYPISPSIRTLKKYKKLCEYFLYFDPKDIQWIDLCDFTHTHKCYSFSLGLITILLNKNLYFGNYKEDLYSKKEKFNIIMNEKQKEKEINNTNTITNFNNFRVLTIEIFCKEKISDLEIYYSKYKGNEESLYCINFKCKNKNLKSLIIDFLSMPYKYTRIFKNKKIYLHFEDSLGKYSNIIFSYKDFNSNTFFEQINYFKNLYKDNNEYLNYSFRAIIYFYRYLVDTYSEYKFFKNSITMNESLLFSQRLSFFISEGYTFLPYNQNIKVKDYKKIVFLLNGFDNVSTKIQNEDYSVLDLSTIKNYFYRIEVLNYALCNTKILTMSKKFLIDGLNFLIDLKLEKNYPNPNIKYINSQELIFLNEFVSNKYNNSNSKSSAIYTIKSFFEWEKNTKRMQFEYMALSYLSSEKAQKKSNVKIVSDQNLIDLHNCLNKHAKENDLVAKLCYCVFHLLINTEFRIGQICNLTIDCIKKSVKPNELYIYSNNKTSNQDIEKSIITKKVYEHIVEIIHETDEIRNNCSVKNRKDYIFIYKKNTDSVSILTPNKFISYMQKCAKELGWDKYYTSTNLRATHMTKAFEYILRNDRSNLDMYALSHHTQIDTTKNYYIQLELEKILESTYGIIIGDFENLIDNQKNIQSKIPKEIDRVENIVENGCGNCSAKLCSITTSLPCLICKNFITTPKHERYFIKAIENIDKLIDSANSKHDKDDLTTIKTLYVLYLKQIYKFKEENIYE